MARLERILVGTDFSDHARTAMKQAAALAKQLDAELVLCHVMEPLPLIAGPTETPHSDRASDLRATCEEWLKESGISSGRVLIEQGHAFAEIVRIARNEEADLIVLGSHGRGPISHMLIGSVAERVVRKAPCSVLVIREGQSEFEFP